MKKFFTFVILALVAVSVWGAGPILSESFNYAINTGLAGDRISSNITTTDVANWYRSNTSGISAEMKIIDDNLTYPNYCTNATGHAVEISAKHYNEYRQFTKVEAGNGNKVFLSALIKINSCPNTTGDFVMGMTPRGSLSKPFAKLAVLKTSDNGYKLGISKQAEIIKWLNYTDELEFGKTYLVVMKYEWVDGTKNDIASLYVNPTSATSEPTITCIQSVFNENNIQQGACKADDASDLGVVAILQTANTPRDMIIDEIKVFTDWSDISLPSGSDDPVEPTPILSVTKSSIDFGKFIKGETYEETFKVTASDLKEDITISSDNTDVVLVSPSVISKDNPDLEGDGVVVTASINPERQFSFSGVKITVASKDAESKVVTAKGTALVIERLSVSTLGFFNTTAQNYNPSSHNNVPFEDVIFTYTGSMAKIFSYDDIMHRLTVTDGSVDDNGDAIQIFVYVNDEDWETLPIAQGNKIKELEFTATMSTSAITGKTTYFATPSKLSFVTNDDTRAFTSADIGTICLPGQVNNLDEIPATFYKILYKEGDPEAPTNVVFEEVDKLEAGVPYIFMPKTESGEMHFIYREQVTYEPQNDNANGLIGTFKQMNITQGMYLIYNNMVCKAGTGCDLAANRAYINMSQVPTKEEGEPKAAPGMNRVSLVNPNGIPGSTTGCKTLNAKANYRKVMMGGNLVIINNDKKINVLGQTVK